MHQAPLLVTFVLTNCATPEFCIQVGALVLFCAKRDTAIQPAMAALPLVWGALPAK